MKLTSHSILIATSMNGIGLAMTSMTRAGGIHSVQQSDSIRQLEERERKRRGGGTFYMDLQTDRQTREKLR